MGSDGDRRHTEEFQSPEEWAAAACLRKGSDDWSSEDQAELESRLKDPGHLQAYQSVAGAWRALGRHAAAPELENFRREAVERVRRKDSADGRLSKPGMKWAVAASLTLILSLTAALLLSLRSEIVYETGIGEQRIVELADRSRIALDAKTSVRVRFSGDSRVVKLLDGQAQFMVARDPRRPFRVDVGEHTITAVGTSFNVDHTDQGMQVAMVEGKVVVSVVRPRALDSRVAPLLAALSESRDLVAGQVLRVDPDGQTQLLANADIAAAIAWRQGKIILTDTTLGEAVRRFNRYSRMQIAIDEPEIEALHVSGVFECGDTEAFIEAIQSSLPITAVPEGTDLMRLRSI